MPAPTIHATKLKENIPKINQFNDPKIVKIKHINVTIKNSFLILFTYPLINIQKAPPFGGAKVIF